MNPIRTVKKMTRKNPKPLTTFLKKRLDSHAKKREQPPTAPAQ